MAAFRGRNFLRGFSVGLEVDVLDDSVGLDFCASVSLRLTFDDASGVSGFCWFVLPGIEGNSAEIEVSGVPVFRGGGNEDGRV